MKALNITPLEPAKALKTQVYEALKDIIGHMDITGRNGHMGAGTRSQDVR